MQNIDSKEALPEVLGLRGRRRAGEDERVLREQLQVYGQVRLRDPGGVRADVLRPLGVHALLLR